MAMQLDGFMLHELITSRRDEIIGRCRTKVATRTMPPPAEAAVDHGVPVFLNQLAEALRLGLISVPEIGTSAARLGQDLLQRGFTVSQVVHNYGDVCQAITDMAVELDVPIGANDFRTLNRCLDEAIAGAVTAFGRAQNQSGVEAESARGDQRLGFFAHEMRNLVQTALLAFEVLKTGQVGIGGTTGTVLHRTLRASRTLIERSLAEMRMTHGVHNPDQFLVAGFIAEVAAGAVLEAHGRGIGLTVVPVADGIAIEADREVLAAVVGNLLQNAFKFTRPLTTVTLSVGVRANRVLIEVRDECGGLPSSDPEELFRPFEQRSADRSGQGLGLAFSRWGAEANHGRISACNHAEGGCVFTIDLPRIDLPRIDLPLSATV
jgi:signal transduction histidine kinase